MDKTLKEFIDTNQRTFSGWSDQLPDDVFNQAWDALNDPSSGIGENTVMKWLVSLGYTGGTPNKVKRLRSLERR
jgi:hypothetical protein